ARGSRICNSHLAEGNHVWDGRLTRKQLRTVNDRASYLADRQCARLRKISRSSPDLHVLDAVEPSQLGVYSKVRRHHAGTNGARKRRDGRSARAVRSTHLRRDFARVRADTLDRDAMIGGQHEDDGVHERWWRVTVNERESQGNRLQIAKAPARF